MVKIVLLGSLLLNLACSEENAEDVGVSQRTVAVVDEAADRTLVLFSAQQNLAELDDVLAGDAPKTFRWVSIEIPASISPDLMSEKGVSIDLTKSQDSVVFAQVYRDVCNPAADDFSPCWLYERYTAGEEGLTGGLQLRSIGTQVEAQFSVQWEGLTDRFAGQQQWHRHETDVSMTATIVEVPK